VAETKGKVICPNCRIEMNHHGDKLVYAADLPQVGAIDPSLGGFIEEFHTCPKCGDGASRHAPHSN
jgi:ribosomal protein S27AE